MESESARTVRQLWRVGDPYETKWWLIGDNKLESDSEHFVTKSRRKNVQAIRTNVAFSQLRHMPDVTRS